MVELMHCLKSLFFSIPFYSYIILTLICCLFLKKYIFLVVCLFHFYLSLKHFVKIFLKKLLFYQQLYDQLSNTYSQKLLKYVTDSIKTASRRRIQKTAEATGDLIGN